MSGASIHVSILFWLAVLFALYFLPTLIARLRGHRNWAGVAILNTLLGWTGLGWIASLIWSVARGGEYVRREDYYDD